MLSANVERIVEVITREESMGIVSYKIINKLMKHDGDKLFTYLNDTLNIFNQVLVQ